MRLYNELIHEASNKIEAEIIEHVSESAVEKVRHKITIELEEESILIILTDWFIEMGINIIIRKLLQEYIEACMIFPGYVPPPIQ